jgi:hypothetical protein
VFVSEHRDSTRKIQIFLVPSQNNDSHTVHFITDIDNTIKSLSEKTSLEFNTLWNKHIDIINKFLIESLLESPNPNVISELMETDLSDEIKSQITTYLIRRLEANEC